jgi:hypothetical protein
VIEAAIIGGGGAALGITATVLVWLAWRRTANAEQSRGEMAAKASALDGRLLAATTSAEAWKAEANDRGERILKLTELINDVAKDLPPDGARARLHARWFAIHNPAVPAAAANKPELVRDPGSEATGPDGLIDPWPKG